MPFPLSRSLIATLAGAALLETLALCGDERPEEEAYTALDLESKIASSKEPRGSAGSGLGKDRSLPSLFTGSGGGLVGIWANFFLFSPAHAAQEEK